MRSVLVFVIKLNKFDALILLKGGEFFKLLTKQIYSEFHRGVLTKIIESLKLLGRTLSVFHANTLNLVAYLAAQSG